MSEKMVNDYAEKWLESYDGKKIPQFLNVPMNHLRRLLAENERLEALYDHYKNRHAQKEWCRKELRKRWKQAKADRFALVTYVRAEHAMNEAMAADVPDIDYFVRQFNEAEQALGTELRKEIEDA